MKTADLSDAHPAQLRLCNLPFRRFGTKASLSGPVQTVACFEDNTALRAELERLGDGRVLIADGGGSTRVALLGDILADLAIRNGWAGIVINGAIRDSAEIDAMALMVLALGTSPIRSAKRGWGQAGGELGIGGVTVRPGMFAYADADGLLLAPAGDLQA